MKKILIIASFLALAPLSASAATIILSPQSVQVVPGQMVTLTLSVDPQGAPLSAVMADVSYPASLLTPTSFSFAPTWVPVAAQGYDQMSDGVVIKSAGYPGGLASPATYGTLTFKAVAAGTATVSIESNSLAYDSNSTNRIDGAQGSATVTIAAGSNANAQVSGTQSQGTSTNLNIQAGPASSTQPGAGAGVSNQGAAAATALGASSVPTWLWILAALIILAALAYWYWSRRRS